MPRGGALLLAALLLAAPAATLGSPVKEKRGWTLNSAGYLLGPHAVDNHRSFHDKHGLAGKRDLRPEHGTGAGNFDQPMPVNDDVVRKIMEFLAFLHFKEAAALVPMLPSAASWEDTEQPAPREPGRALAPPEVRL